MSSSAPNSDLELLSEIDPLRDLPKSRVLEETYRSDLLSQITGTDRSVPPSPTRVGLHTSRRTRLWAAVGASGTALAGGVVAAILLLSSTTAPAFAGWSTVPTTATPAALAAATATCNNQFDRGSTTFTVSQAVLSETRGIYTAALYVTADGVYNCIDGLGHGSSASHETAAMIGAAPGASQITFPDQSGASAAGFPGANPHLPFPKQWRQALSQMTNAARRKRQAKRWRMILDQGVVSSAYGQAGSDVSSVTFNFADGLTADATVQNGWYFAWWPTLDRPTSVQVMSSSGTDTSTLRWPGCASGSAGCVFSPPTS
jgi:hypothetical protein